MPYRLWNQVKAKKGELKAQGFGKMGQKTAMDKFLTTVHSPADWKLMETDVSHACCHHPGPAKIMPRIGRAFAEAMIELEDK